MRKAQFLVGNADLTKNLSFSSVTVYQFQPEIIRVDIFKPVADQFEIMNSKRTFTGISLFWPETFIF